MTWSALPPMRGAALAGVPSNVTLPVPLQKRQMPWAASCGASAIQAAPAVPEEFSGMGVSRGACR